MTKFDAFPCAKFQNCCTSLIHVRGDAQEPARARPLMSGREQHPCVLAVLTCMMQGSVIVDTHVDSSSGYVTLRVSDTGPGFTLEQLEKFNTPNSGEALYHG